VPVESFKAREKPNYKFFEPVHEVREPIQFKEFDLSTEERGRKKFRESEAPKTEPKLFKALSVPDYDKPTR
jgi:hypothetical protein